MSFRTPHFDGSARVPSYMAWVVDCDMRGTYEYHRRVLQLLQWHCPPRLWHLKTPVHMFALDALIEAYPDARFLWSHRDPARVLGSVCSLMHYTRSWSSDRDDALELGPEMTERWAEAVERAMDFHARVGDERFADVPFAALQNRSRRHDGHELRAHRARLVRRVRGRQSATGPRVTNRVRTARTTTTSPTSASTRRRFAGGFAPYIAAFTATD